MEAGTGLVRLQWGQDGGAKLHSPCAPFAGDLGQEGKANEPVFPHQP